MSSETLASDKQINTPYLGGTVLEHLGVRPTAPEAGQPQPPPTQPVPMTTHTTSGEGYARISDDQDQEHLYE